MESYCRTVTMIEVNLSEERYGNEIVAFDKRSNKESQFLIYHRETGQRAVHPTHCPVLFLYIYQFLLILSSYSNFYTSYRFRTDMGHWDKSLTFWLFGNQ